MKITGVLGASALLALAGCASNDLRADASGHCAANISSRVLASDCAAPVARTSPALRKVQQRNPAVDGALRQGA